MPKSNGYGEERQYHPNRQVGRDAFSGSGVWGIWHGGHSYAPGGLEHTEQFDSEDHAMGQFEHRASGRDSYYPVVSGSSMDVYRSDPREAKDPYPDYRLTQGENDEIGREDY